MLRKTITTAIMLGLSAAAAYALFSDGRGGNMVQSVLGGQLNLSSTAAAVGPLLNQGRAAGDDEGSPAAGADNSAQLAALMGMLGQRGGAGPAALAVNSSNAMLLANQAAAAQEQPAEKPRDPNYRGYVRVKSIDPATGKVISTTRYTKP